MEINGRTYIQLPHGSYFNWIEPHWLDQYKNVLSYTYGKWIPHMDRLKELAELDKEYKVYQDEIRLQEKAIKARAPLA